MKTEKRKCKINNFLELNNTSNLGDSIISEGPIDLLQRSKNSKVKKLNNSFLKKKAGKWKVIIVKKIVFRFMLCISRWLKKMGKNFKLQKKTVNIKLYILLKYHFWVQVNDIFQLAGWSKSLSEMIYYDKNKKNWSQELLNT